MRSASLVLRSATLTIAWLCVACESSEQPKRAAAAVHPEFPVPPSPEMIAQSEPPSAREPPLSDAGAAISAEAWNPSCLIHRGCPRESRALPSCPAGKVAPAWRELQVEAAALNGKTIDVSGPLGLAPAEARANSGPCAKGVCCHTLRLRLALDGTPLSLPLQGLSCSGDDSKLCCAVPAEGQTVIAHGRLVKTQAPSGVQWQLEGVSLCTPESPPAMLH